MAEYVVMAAAIAGTAMSAYSVMNQPSTPKPPDTSPAADKGSEEAAYAQAQALRKRQGSASTILTGPQGVTNPSTVSKTALGA